MNLDFKRRLPIPKCIKEQYPVTDEMKAVIDKRAKELKDILSGKEDKFILIIGPCSADNVESVMDYLHRLKDIDKKYEDKIFVIPRVYTAKPRTVTGGYMGMFHQPDPTGETDMLKGVIAIRQLFMRAITETGYTVADELLYPDNHRYYNDLLAYVSIGARSVEDQYHRLVASGLNAPVGMKNPTGGNLQILLNSIAGAHNNHDFLYRGWEVHSKGNPFVHGILRGYTSSDGVNHPNYYYEDLLKFAIMYENTFIPGTGNKLPNPAVIVDTNHCNSNKDYSKQIDIGIDVLNSRKKNEKIKSMVKGLMVESYIVDGSQEVGGNTYGQSITDGCIGIEKTEELFKKVYELL